MMRVPKKSELIIFFILMANIIILAVTFSTLFSHKKSSSTIDNTGYMEAFKDSILFYDSNKCGKEVDTDNVFDWRGPCHINDGKDLNLDLAGGYHDGSGNVKYGLPQGYTASILGWSLFEYKDVFNSSGNTDKILSTLKYFTDYFLKCHTSKSTFYYQIGDAKKDYDFNGPPEEDTVQRPTMSVADSTHPASDVCGETSAALTIMYLNYKYIDSAYANKCLESAKELYNMGKNNLGFSDSQSSYVSGSYYDDLAWAAIWLYKAENQKLYLDEAEDFIKRNSTDKKNNISFNNNWTLCWDDVSLACFLELYGFTNKQIYKDALNFNLNYWMNRMKKTKGGLMYLNRTGVLRYAAAESLIAMQWYQITGDNSLKIFAKSQIDYILGANPAKLSYVIGFGRKYPDNVLQRAASDYSTGENENSKKFKHLLIGALVGGPTDDDRFSDKQDSYEFIEVAIDFNAGLVGALASLIKGS